MAHNQANPDGANPYKSPRTEAAEISQSSRIITENMLYYLKGAAPWCRFIAIAGFIYIGFVVIVMAVFVFGSQALFSLATGGGFYGTLFGFGGSTVILLYMLPGVILMFFPCLFLFRFGKRIQNYVRSNEAADLEAAFKNNKFFWAFIGAVAIISLGFLVLMIISSIALALIAVFAV